MAGKKPTHDGPVVPLLVTIGEAARRLAISERALWSLTQAGEVPRVTVGNRGVRIEVAELVKFVGRLIAEASR